MADASQGNPAPQAGQGESGDAPKYVTEEQLNKAITARLRDFEKKVGETIKTSVDGIAPQLDQLLETKLSALKPQGDGKPQNADPAKVDIESHPFVKGLLKRLDESDKRTKAIEADRDAERARAQDADLRRQLGDALAKRGIPADRIRQAIGLLVDAEKRVGRDGDALVFNEKDGAVDLDTGVDRWVKGDDAKIFLPPRGTSGSGDRGAGKKPTAAGQGYERGSLGRALVEEYAPGVTVVPSR